MNCTASSYFIPFSMRAKATKTGALRVEEIHWTVQRESKGGEKPNRRLNVIVHMVTKSYGWGKGRRG